MYGAPSVSLARKAGKLAMKPVKLALRFPGAGLALTGAYYGLKRAVKKSNRPLKMSPYNQFNKKGRKII